MDLTVALHGFLGLPEDWSVYEEAFAGALVAPSLLDTVASFKDGEDAFAGWTKAFTADVGSWSAKKPLLVGYSLGGRLAMHAAIARPDLFSAAVFVSAHPGLNDEKQRATRFDNDRRWAMRFMAEDWVRLIHEWDSQDVFKRPAGWRGDNAIHLSRPEASYDRRALAKALTGWSLAKQADLREGLRGVGIPTLFVCGGDDGKFSEIYEGLRLGPRQKRVVVEQAGHRVPWDQPRAFRREVMQFLSNYGLD